MIGPTGVGKLKSPVARLSWRMRRSSKLKRPNSPKWAVGKEVDSIIRDLTDAAVKMVRVRAIEKTVIALKNWQKNVFSTC